MYPFKGDKIYLRNSWYVAAFSNELDGGPIERVIMDEPVALFRMADGSPSAMWGLCPHRHYPLANGKVIGDAIQCNYHGFRFDGRTGSCVHIPSQSSSPKGFKQRIYPLVEHGPWLWIWPGDPELADPSLLPPLDEIGIGPGWRHDHVGLLPTAGRAQLLVENLADLTHVAFLHAVSVDGSQMLDPKLQFVEDDRRIIATRVSDIPWVAGFYDLLFGSDAKFDGTHQTRTGSWYYCPGYTRTTAGEIVSINGSEQVDRSVYGTVNFHHILTPETPHTTHYFATVSRNYRIDDDSFSQQVIHIDREVRMQDVVAAGEIEERIKRFPLQNPELLCRADVAADKVRRRVQAALDHEAGTA